MALDPVALKNSIQAMFEDRDVANTAEQKAQELADNIHNYIIEAIATVVIPANTFVIAVTGGSGAPAVGILNPSPVNVIGDPDALPPGGLS